MTELLKTDYYKLVDCKHGRFLANPQDMYLGRSMITYGEFSELEWRLLDQMIEPGSVVIEAGANMGAFTVPIAKKVGLGGMVYAFEPQLAVFQQLCANIALNDLMNAQAFHAGCGNVSEFMTIIRPNPSSQNNFGGFQLDQLKADAGIRIRVERLDDVIDTPRLNLIKADVEGMEKQVIEGAKELIAAHRPNLYLEAHEADAPDLIRTVLAMDYDMFWHQPRMFNPENHNGVSDNMFGNIVSRNILCTAAERKVTIKGARKITDPDDYPTKWKD